jgi:hypothetical protein
MFSGYSANDGIARVDAMEFNFTGISGSIEFNCGMFRRMYAGTILCVPPKSQWLVIMTALP